MKNSSPKTLLEESIRQLEIRRAQELIILNAQFQVVSESFKPINLINDAFKTVTATNDLKTGVGRSMLGLASGLLVKKLFFRNTQNPVMKAASILLQTATAGFVANNSDKINLIGRKLLNFIFSKYKH